MRILFCRRFSGARVSRASRAHRAGRRPALCAATPSDHLPSVARCPAPGLCRHTRAHPWPLSSSKFPTVCHFYNRPLHKHSAPLSCPAPNSPPAQMSRALTEYSPSRIDEKAVTSMGYTSIEDLAARLPQDECLLADQQSAQATSRDVRRAGLQPVVITRASTGCLSPQGQVSHQLQLPPPRLQLGEAEDDPRDAVRRAGRPHDEGHLEGLQAHVQERPSVSGLFNGFFVKFP